MTQVIRRKKTIVPIRKGKVYITATFNNALISVTDERGNVLGWSSAGNAGFKGTKKSTPYAATLATKKAIDRAAPYELKEVQIFISGVGSGRDAAMRAVGQSGLTVLGIKDITPIPHNGPRPKKPRRV
jgi:small subunit ribosomal protein S11